MKKIIKINLLALFLITPLLQSMELLKPYKPSTEQEKKRAKENATELSELLTKSISNTLPIGPLFTAAGPDKEAKGTIKTANNVDYTWSLNYSKIADNIYLFIKLFKKNLKLGSVNCTITTGDKGIEKKIRVYISKLFINAPFRQYGFGKAMASTVLELATQFKQNTKVHLIAGPEDEKMKDILIKWYKKEFGFVPFEKKFNGLKLYFTDIGTKVASHEIAGYLENVHKNAIKAYLVDAKNFAKEIGDFIKQFETASSTDTKNLKTVLERAQNISCTIQKVDKTTFSLVVFVGEQKFKTVIFSVTGEKDAKKIVLLKNYKHAIGNGPTTDKIINFIAANTLFELQKTTDNTNDNLPEGIPTNWCSLWGHSIEKKLVK